MADATLDFIESLDAEVVVDAATGTIRQAGTVDSPAGPFIQRFRRLAERSLYVFAKAVLDLTRLTPTLHAPACDWLQRVPPYRKLLLLPRDTYKSSMVAKALPIHLLIQPRESNAYFPGRDGASTRILLANETATNAEHFLRWIEGRFESKAKLRALWPQCCWDNPRKQSRKWNEKEMVIPRADDYPEASIETIGVGGAITSRHYDVLCKDDLISLEAANSPLVMQTAIEWHKASRALMDDPDKSLEFMVGTRWSVADLYSDIIDTDPSVDVMVRSIIEDGKSILPDVFSLETIGRLQREFGTLFPLLYMNCASDPTLTDFAEADLRVFAIEGDRLRFDEDERDLALRERHGAPRSPVAAPRGTPLTPERMRDMFVGREEFLRLRYG